MTENSPDNQFQRSDRNRFNRPRTSKEWKLIEKMVLSAQDEQRKTRRWGLFFKFSILAYLLIVLMVFKFSAGWDSTPNVSEPHVALVDVQGVIMEDSPANADRLVEGLQKAFEAEYSKGVIVRINSPGGSPVQSGLVYREIQRLKQIYSDKKVYAVIMDVGASGAYYVAAAADEIYSDPASLVGSIGVISPGFGFFEAINKLGIERRIYSSGTNKAFLDPFLPQDEEQAAFLSTILTDVHQQFIDAVKQGRGDRLHNDEKVFSGLFWSGRQALSLGLVDGLASAGQVAREIVGVENIVDYTPVVSPLDAFTGRLGVTMADRIASLLGITGGLQLK